MRAWRLSAATLAAFLIAGTSASAAKLNSTDVKGGTRVIQSYDIEEHFASGTLVGGGNAICPPLTRVFTGGAYVHRPGSTEPAARRRTHVTNSMPTDSGSGWYADAVDRGNDPMTITIIVRCLPELDDTVIVERVSKTVDLGSDSGRNATAKCPHGFRAITGGAYFTDGSGVDPDSAPSKFVSSVPTRDARGWFARGVTFGSADLTVTVHCVDGDQLAGYKRKEVKTPLGGGEALVETTSCPDSHPVAGPAGALLLKQDGKPAGDLDEGDSLLSRGVIESVRKFAAAASLFFKDSDPLTLVIRGFCLR
ncbi:MAG: hypothetical protein QOI31_154 [Solirubrobacterales bacterium]|jgi:hypothetical protein|nr:hypothetical protein [Solirubrobacterales bacterium]